MIKMFYQPCLMIIANFLLMNTIEYYIHKLSHNHKYGGILYKYHHKHHTIDYPPTKLIRDKNDKVDSTNGPFKVLLLYVYILFYFLLPYSWYLLFLIETSLYFYVMDKIHDYYHLDNTYLDKYNWFVKLKKKHHTHHKVTTKNLNLVFLINDKIHKSLSIN